MKETPKHHIRYPDGTDLVRNASAQFKDMAQSIDNNIDDLPDTILVKVKDATARTEKAAADAEKYSGGAVAMQDGAVAGLLGDASSATRAALSHARYAPGSHAVFIGDSITQGYLTSSGSKRWSTILCRMFDWIEHNYAVGGTGWINGAQANRFDGQCSRAAADSSYDHMLVSHVFLFGGVNDGAGDTATATERARQCVATLRAAYPNARIVTGTGMQGPLKVGATQGGVPVVSRLVYYRSVARALQGTGVVCVPDCWRWLMTRPDLCNDDLLHPNDAGHAVIAGIMAQIVQGTYSTPTVADNQPVYQVSYAANVTVRRIGLDVGADRVTVYGSVEAQVADDSKYLNSFSMRLPLFQMPDWCRIVYNDVIPAKPAISVNRLWTLFDAYLYVDDDRMVNVSVNARYFKPGDDRPEPPLGYKFKAGDKIKTWINWTMPIWGYSN